MVDRVLETVSTEASEETYDTSEPKEVNKARKKYSRTRADRLHFVEAAMTTEQGRAWFYDLMVFCKVVSTPFDEDPYRTAFQCGQQNVGLRVLSDIQMSAPEKYLLMIERKIRPKMADEPLVPITPADSTPVTPQEVTPAPAPASEIPAVAPVVVPEPVVPTPAVVVPETPPVAVPEAPKAAETALGEALDKDKNPTPVEPPKEGEVPVVTEDKQGGQSDEPAPPPSYEPFKLPEDVKLEPERMGVLTGLLAELETTGKVEHAAMQEFGQKLLDTHISELKQTVDNIQKHYTEAWEKQKLSWKDDFLKDPILGGNRFQTTINSALNFIRTHGGTPEEQLEFRNLMETSGLGNNKTMIRILAKAGSSMSEGVPLAGVRPVQAPKSKVTTMYGKSAQ